MDAVLTITRHDFDAAVFDLDGVLTDTARIHASTWKTVFDEFLRKRAEREGTQFEPFDEISDYLAYVDGRTRSDGVRSFLMARGIELPTGGEIDPLDADTVRSLGMRKGQIFRDELARGIDAAPGAEALLKKLRHAAIGVAVASASKNCAGVLRAAGLDRLADVRVDGIDAEQLGLKGKPDPALFLEAARRLGAEPLRIIVFEDALAGIEAGQRGGFGCVVGVRGEKPRETFRQHGASLVIQSLRQVEVADFKL